MEEKEELKKIINRYDPKIVQLYNRIIKIEKDNANRIKQTDIRNMIKDAIFEVAK